MRGARHDAPPSPLIRRDLSPSRCCCCCCSRCMHRGLEVVKRWFWRGGVECWSESSWGDNARGRGKRQSTTTAHRQGSDRSIRRHATRSGLASARRRQFRDPARTEECSQPTRWRPDNQACFRSHDRDRPWSTSWSTAAEFGRWLVYLRWNSVEHCNSRFKACFWRGIRARRWLVCESC